MSSPRRHVRSGDAERDRGSDVHREPASGTGSPLLGGAVAVQRLRFPAVGDPRSPRRDADRPGSGKAPAGFEPAGFVRRHRADSPLRRRRGDVPGSRFRVAAQLAADASAGRGERREVLPLPPAEPVRRLKAIWGAGTSVALQDSVGYRHSVVAAYPLLRDKGLELGRSGVHFHDMTQVFAEESRRSTSTTAATTTPRDTSSSLTPWAVRLRTTCAPRSLPPNP